MSIKEQIKKVAELLDGKKMYFDWSSYDLEEDIPHLIFDGARENIESVVISKDGTFMEVLTKEGKLVLALQRTKRTPLRT